MNEYVWKLYLESGGYKTVEFFKNNFENDLSFGYVDGISSLQKKYCVSNDTLSNTRWFLEKCVEDLQEDIYECENTEEYDEDNFEDIIDEIMNEIWHLLYDNHGTDQNSFKAFLGDYNPVEDIIYLSTIFSLDYPEYIIPYYFQCNFNVVQIIADSFDIELPPLPVKKDYKGRFFYYGELCKVFTKYRLDNGWSPYELFAFLYDFAPNYIGGIDSYIIKDLPEPKSAFFIGGGGNNADAVAEDDPDDICCWQCNPDTRAGDMVVMYLRTPISAISSIWRSCSIGFNDPFFFYYRCTYVGNPVKVKRLGINDIKKDRVLSKMPIVHKNMQGLNGVELKPSEYNHIVDKTKAKVTKLEYEEISSDNKYVNERDVEDRLIKPFLNNIGYGESDYEQQIRVPIGNHNNTLIPDFVIAHKTYGGSHVAFTVIEAKKSIKNNKELAAALDQVGSYALLLSAKYAVIASQEGIWITTSNSRYKEFILNYSWQELEDDDKMYEVRKMLGKNM
ncbi:hypothetical protein SAMN06297422_101173 [Lachnospiraceae bacterium]|nr:hypothetical protein SAMN06297422_101173 [Lachnospiraceae bacterium]